ncbi:MAG: divalent-cation tolerance protein CutA [Spirochaetia bacterium]|nr:divalent-cation tolerance protein CutA [Spirochaetia bacterium]
MQPVLVTTTVNSKEEANKIANILVNEKLAACVNIIGPIQSIYMWQDKIVNDEEYKLFIKTFAEKWPSLKNTIKKNHSYQVPEISLIQIHDMHEDYLSWMKDSII